MITLSNIQQDFKSYLLSDNESIARLVAGENDAFVMQRLAIYADAYYIRLLEALENNFPTLRDFAGEALFEEFGQAYIAAYPSQNFSVRYFGHLLSIFLAETKPYSAQPILSDLARYEWVLGEVMDAADAPLLTVEEVAAISQAEWPTLCFQLHPSVQLIDLRWNVPELAKDAKCATLKAAVLDNPGHTTWVVWRKDIQAYYRENSEAQAWALRALEQNQTFADVCEGLCQWFPEDQVAQQAVSFLITWLRDGLLSTVE